MVMNRTNIKNQNIEVSVPGRAFPKASTKRQRQPQPKFKATLEARSEEKFQPRTRRESHHQSRCFLHRLGIRAGRLLLHETSAGIFAAGWDEEGESERLTPRGHVAVVDPPWLDHLRRQRQRVLPGSHAQVFPEERARGRGQNLHEHDPAAPEADQLVFRRPYFLFLLSIFAARFRRARQLEEECQQKRSEIKSGNER